MENNFFRHLSNLKTIPKQCQKEDFICSLKVLILYTHFFFFRTWQNIHINKAFAQA